LGYQQVEKSNIPVFFFYYSGGKAASYAEVTIWSPVNKRVEFQNGRTDKNGVFTFCPDSEGTWLIEVNDGLGHKMKAVYETKSAVNQFLQNKERTQQKSMLLPAILGISMIFNVAVLIKYIGFKKKSI